MYIYRVSNVYLSYIFRVCIEIYSGLQAAKLLPFLRDMQENSQSEIYLIEEFYVKKYTQNDFFYGFPCSSQKKVVPLHRVCCRFPPTVSRAVFFTLCKSILK